MIRLVLMYVLFGMAVSLAGAAVSEGVFPSPGSNPLAGWQVNVPAGLEIKVESDGSLRVKDPVGSSGGSAGGIKTAPVWEGNPEEQPTYFSLTVAFQDVPVTLAHPALMVGFADEGGNGRGILLGFFRPSENEWLIGLVDNQAGLRVPVSLKKFADSTVHEYRVVKYRDPGDAVMKVQVLVDGKPAMKDPFPYSGLPSARGTKDGFRLTTLSPSRVTASVKHIQFGPFIGDAPLLAEDDSESERPERFSPVEATWTWTAAGADSSTKFAETNEGMAIPTPAMGALESDFVPLSGNRFYTLRAEVESGASAGRLRVKVRQYSRRSMEPESPDFASDWYVFKAGRPDVKVELPFYMQQASGRGRFILEIESGGTLRVKSVECGSPQSWPAVVRPVDSEDLVSEETAVNTIRERKASSAGLKAEKHHVAMLVDQNQVAPCIYDTMGSLHPDTSSPSMAARAGIHLQCRVLPSAVTGGGDAVWMGKDTYRMENVDAQIMRILRADPQAKIILMINVDPYPAWGSENPDEVCMNQKGQRAIGVEHFSIWGDKPGGGRFLPSLYSERVRQDAKAYLQAVVDHLENDPLGKAVIGYGVIGFNDYQFVNWAHWEAFKGDMDDYSPAAVRAFRNWLRSRYRDDVTLLQQAWKQPEITFESATIPQPQRRRGPELWLDPEKDQDVADFNRFYIEGPIEFISSLADSVKERTGGKKLVATYFASAMNGSTSGSGLGRMLNVPSVDLLFAPADYSIRLPGYPSGTQTAPDAVRLAGKLFIHEQDWPSYHTPIRFEAMDFAFGRAPTPEALSAMVKRDTGNMIARRQGTSFYELHVGAFSGREAVEIMSDAKKAMENCLDPIGKERVQVAFFIGERSLDYLKMPSGSSYRWSLLRLARRHWDTSGVPY
ncbi:MAG: beta-galactosidase, partial [Verrucomicrobia bacterium]|nr:beta-galactosidase [Verrucomicrobiota bacterium]